MQRERDSFFHLHVYIIHISQIRYSN